VDSEGVGRWKGGGFGGKGRWVVIKVGATEREYVEWAIGDNSRNIIGFRESHRGNGTEGALDGKAGLVAPSNVKNGLNDVTS